MSSEASALVISESQLDELKARARALCASGKGILAADESVRTIGKRLEGHGLKNDAETRRRLREMLVTSPDPLENWLSGVILFEETLTQRVALGAGKEEGEGQLPTFAEYLTGRGIMPGIKVDTGLQPLPDSERETHTMGLDSLRDRCERTRAQGALFAKWRAALRIDDDAGLPSDEAIARNAEELAQYAHIALQAGLVPIVEPEILVDGVHDGASAARAARRVIPAVYAALEALDVPLGATLLKPMMITPGVKCDPTIRKRDADPDAVAGSTLDVIRDTVPPDVPGIMFLSGGMTEQEATACLDCINKLARSPAERANPAPWALSFSFGRALQTSATLAWAGREDNREQASDVAARIARANSQACVGSFEGDHPSLSKSESLYENFRGWQGNVPSHA